MQDQRRSQSTLRCFQQATSSLFRIAAQESARSQQEQRQSAHPDRLSLHRTRAEFLASPAPAQRSSSSSATPASGDIEGVTAGTGLSGGGTSGTVTLSIDSTVATLTGSQTLTNKTLTSPAINNATNTNSVFITPEERTTVTATAATGTVNYDALTQGVLYYTSNASANFTLNFRGSGAATLSSMLAVGDAISLVFLNTNGATAYYPTVYQIDGSAVTPKWSGGTAPAAGNANSIDAYSFTIIKTAATPTYTVLAGGAVKFA